MSSHHIVREKQEPALLLLSLNGFDDEQLGQLLEWSPTVFTTPLVAEQLNAFGIKIDWIVGDDAAADIQSDIRYLKSNGKPASVAAFDYLVDKNYPAVNIVTAEFVLDDYLPYMQNITLVVFCRQKKIYGIESGFSKWKPAGDIIEIISNPENLETKGLVKTDQNIFKTAADGFFSLTFDNKLLFIAESL
ncbi:thiamine pyrophosphokinase [Mucilaginibacter ximonensis]|uniref:Thiamine pyrophosphokinase n=1 Tax=Mucilaginibacter ximonensis TaxID=538021 RepID=A0ABW5YCQ3_9SPHI